MPKIDFDLSKEQNLQPISKKFKKLSLNRLELAWKHDEMSN